jgi:RNA recognition motif-containing protein
MSTRLYVGNLPQSFDQKELEGLFAAVGAGVRFKAVLDRETGGCRGFGFVNVDDAKLTDEVIAQFNGREYGGNQLKVEVSEKRESRGNERGGNSSAPNPARKSIDKVVHSDAPAAAAPDPRWAGELSKLKDLLANQKTTA